ncbi:hypothetical protein PtA15_3A250 [Puccinia triticina]|uniref:Uncharacterized protein n=1 Tax=Puccinia triticina TaxID=208348 RepID=A0ABY7CCP4_9BASI|nr:uncharacterized protein PtA15_3A250 [Puccinia triticina]WAQ82885.1 hypothetical protein PtA15_3A250 [Puccinia triticina]WAR53712.1 hypothetical protein PtB15_3B221 [Puccinia triticina]
MLFKSTLDQVKAGVAAHFKNCPGQKLNPDGFSTDENFLVCGLDMKAGSIAVPGHKEVFVEIKIRAPVGTAYEAWNADAVLNKPYCIQGAQAIGDSGDCIK